MNGLYAGLDVSTQGTKLVVVDLASEKVVYKEVVTYDKDLPAYNTKNGVNQNQPEGVSESDPKMWIEAVEQTFSNLKNSDVPIDQVRSISVSGQQHGLVSIDADGNLTRPVSKLWNDFSTTEECKLMTEAAGGDEAMIREVGNSQRTGYTAAKIYHMVRNEPENYAKTTTFFLVHNYINFYLTGGVRVMEPGDTSGMALWHPGTGKWSESVIKAIAPDLMSKLPEIKPADQSIGKISSDLVAKFGFSPDCTIDAGCGDNMYGAIGTGNVEPGIVTISLGTSGTAFTMMEEPFIDPKGEIAAFCDSTGHWLPLLCVSNLANGFNDLVKLHDLSYDDFDDLVEEEPPGNNGKVLIPWYMGERTPDVPQASPVYFGFGLDDFSKSVLCRAVTEGHILNLYDGFKRMPVIPKEIRVTGGLSRSPVWCQIIADVFESEVVPIAGEGAALGAALHAAWVWQKENGEAIELKDLVKPFVSFNEPERKVPILENVQVHKKQKAMFSALSARVRGVEGDDPFKLRSEML